MPATLIRFYGSLLIWGTVFFLGWIAPLASQQAVYPVFVPVDDQGEPVGDLYYVPEELRQLLLANQDAGVFRKNWSITGAKYLCSFSFNARPQQGQGSTSINFKAVYEINLEAESATIILPNLPVLPGGTKWDDLMVRPVSFPVPENVPENDSQPPGPGQLLIHVEGQKPGQHLLEISLNPTVEQVGAVGRRIVLPSIPKVADAVLELNLSPEMPTISVEESLGQTTDVPGKRTVQLGPTEKLTLTWNDNTARASQSVVETEQFYLLSAQANQIGVSVLHKFRIAGEKIKQLDLVFDPALSPTGNPTHENPAEGGRLSFEPISPSEGLTRLIFREPVSGSITLRVNYRIKDFSGIGVVRFPRIPPSPYRLIRCWVGVSSAQALEFDSLPDSTVNLERFRQEWGTVSEDRFLAAYEAGSLPSFWMLSVRAKKPTTHAKTRQAILIHQNRIDYFVETTLESDGSRFSHSFLVPENLRIGQVEARTVNTAIADSYSYQPIPIDWRLCPPSPETPEGFRVLSILSETPFREREKQEVTLRGAILTMADEPVRNLLLVQAEQTETEEHRLDIFHDPLVVVQEISLPESWKKSEELPLVKPEFLSAIPCGTWASDAAQEKSPIRLKVIPNSPQVSGRQITWLSWNVSTERFEVTTTFDLLVEDGELSTLRLRYDDQCEFPPTAVPSMRMEEVLDEEERSILLRFPQPLSGKTVLTLKSTVNAVPESVSLPKIVPGEPFSIRHYVVLPNDHVGRLVQWEKNQLLPVQAAESEEILQSLEKSEADLPSSRSAILATSENYEVLMVAGQDFNARLVPMGGRPTVPLNDVHLYLRKNGYISGVSTFDLQGNGTDSCVLILPESYELVSITSGGITTRGTELSPGRWRFDLWSSQLPQKVEVVFRGQLTPRSAGNLLFDIRHGEVSEESLLPMYVSENQETLSIPLPSLESTNVLGTIWTLAMETPTHSRPLRFFVDQNRRQESEEASEEETANTVLPLSAREAIPCLIFMNSIRLSNMETLMSGVSTTLSSPPEDIARWYSFWGRSWWGFQRELDSLLISQQVDPRIASSNPWRRSLFQTKNQLPKSMERIFDSKQRPDQLRQELTELYKKAIPASLQAQSREFESDLNESTAFAAFRMSYSENISYLFGASGGEVETLYVVSLPDQPTLWENETVRWTLGVLVVSCSLILVRWIHPRRLFRQYPFFIGHFVAILLWLLLPPGFLGLALLPLLWLAMLWPSWKRSRSLD